MTQALDLFGLPNDMEQGFEDFHSLNPEVYERLVGMVARAHAKGRARVGMGMLFEVLRWNHYMSTRGEEPFKLNNNYRAFYTRLIDRDFPHLGQIITRRGSVADD